MWRPLLCASRSRERNGSENKQGSYDHRPQMQLLWRAEYPYWAAVSRTWISHQLRRRQSSGYGLICRKTSGKTRETRFDGQTLQRDELGKTPKCAMIADQDGRCGFHHPSSPLAPPAGGRVIRHENCMCWRGQ